MTSQISLESLNLSWVHGILFCSFCLTWNSLPELISGGGGVGIRMSWVENFLKINKRGATSIRDQRVQTCNLSLFATDFLFNLYFSAANSNACFEFRPFPHNLTKYMIYLKSLK